MLLQVLHHFQFLLFLPLYSDTRNHFFKCRYIFALHAGTDSKFLPNILAPLNFIFYTFFRFLESQNIRQVVWMHHSDVSFLYMLSNYYFTLFVCSKAEECFFSQDHIFYFISHVKLEISNCFSDYAMNFNQLHSLTLTCKNVIYNTTKIAIDNEVRPSIRACIYIFSFLHLHCLPREDALQKKATITRLPCTHSVPFEPSYHRPLKTFFCNCINSETYLRT